MAIRFSTSGSSGSSLSITVPTNWQFDTDTDRDTYFSTYSDELANGIYITVNGTLERYSTSTSEWYDVSTIMQGDSGSDVIIQYSTDNSTWTTTLSSDSTYIRFSTDGGSTYSEGIQFVAETLAEYSVNGSTDWHDTYDSGTDYYVRFSYDGGTTYTDAIKVASSGLLIQYSVSGTSWHSTRTDSDVYWRWSTDNGETWSDAANFSSDGSGIPSPYVATVGDDGELIISDGSGDQVFILTDDGLSISSVTVGTGSIHIRDILSIGSGGTQVSFVDEINQVAHYPSWGELSLDGTTYIPVSDRVHGDLTTSVIGTSADTNTVVDFNATHTLSSDQALFKFTFIPAEDYSGSLRWEATNTAGQIIGEYTAASGSMTTGNSFTVQLQYPIWAESGSEISVALYNSEGSYIQAYAGSSSSEEPYRVLYLRSYEDYKSYNESNISDLVDNINETYTDADGIDYTAIKNVPLATDSELGVIKVDGSTITVDSNGVISSDVAAATKVSVASEADMLALTEIDNLYIVTRTDLEELWYLNANLDPSVLSNWLEGSSVADTVASFTGAQGTTRNGAVIAEAEDYTMDMVYGTDTSTTTQYYLEITDGVLYMVEV